MRETRTQTVYVRNGGEVESDDDLYVFHDPNHGHWEDVPNSEFRKMDESQARAIGCDPCQHCYDVGPQYVVEL